MKRYWFKPKRFWGWFAAYYPVSREGWILTFLAAVAIALIFFSADRTSHLASDTLYGFFVGIVVVLLVLDIIIRLTSEYPRWWHKK